MRSRLSTSIFSILFLLLLSPVSLIAEPIKATSINAEPLNDNYGGLTIITHGYKSNTGTWVQDIGKAIYVQMESKVSIKVMYINKDFNDNVIDLFAPMPSETVENLILLVYWELLAGLDYNHDKTTVTSTVLHGLSLYPEFKEFLSLPIHLIAHSRGGSVGSYIAKELGLRGIIVDQSTMLDHHPMESWVSAITKPPQVFQDVIYSDIYYQSADLSVDLVTLSRIVGYADMNSSEIHDLTYSVRDLVLYPLGAHFDVHEFYLGTILDKLTDKSQYIYYYGTELDDSWFNKLIRLGNKSWI